MQGHAGKILIVDLSQRKSQTIPTARYEQWVGGLGMGMAVFWDEVDKQYITDTARINGFEPDNVICVMSGVGSGTMIPGGARTTVCGISPEVYPRPQFLSSNFGGDFGSMLKFAGYDGIVIEGRAEQPVWIDIRDEVVQIRNAEHLWGKGFYQTQREIWGQAGGTAQAAAILGIGQAGEALARIACLVHGADSAAGSGGFGGVFGSKNLKAISVLGTGSLPIANPEALLGAWQYTASFRPKKYMDSFPVAPADKRLVACLGCAAPCKVNTPETRLSGGATGQCAELIYYSSEDKARHGRRTEAQRLAVKLAQDHGINMMAAFVMLLWLESLHKRGLLGKGKQIDTDLDFDKLGSEEFVQQYMAKIVRREDIGDDLAEGWVRTAAKWGLLEEDLRSGLINAIYWGVGEQHWTNSHIDWAYLSLFDTRDCNAHDIRYFAPSLKQTAKRFAELAPPWHDELMLDQSRTGVYSESCARLVSWHSRYTSAKGSVPWCDCFPFDTYNELTEDGRGITPEMEERFFAAVTGEDWSWEHFLELGRRIWNFRRAILTLHGRHRNEEYFPPYPPYTSYVYNEGPPTLQWGCYAATISLDRDRRASFDMPSMDKLILKYPVQENGEWRWSKEPFALERDKMDDFKTRYYALEGWDVETGWPTRSTLEGCGLADVAATLERRGKHLKP